MPKGSIQIPGSRKMKTTKSKFKLGNRKSNTGGLGLTTEALLETFDKTERGRDKQKIKQILEGRGEDVYALSAMAKAARADAEAAQVEA